MSAGWMCLALVVLAAPTVHASPIAVEVRGEIAFVDGSAGLDPSIVHGAAFVAAYTADPDIASVRFVDDGTAEYSGALVDPLVVQVGDQIFQFDEAVFTIVDGDGMRGINNEFDLFVLTTDPAQDIRFRFILGQLRGTTLRSTDLFVAPMLADFDLGNLELGVLARTDDFVVRARVDRITTVPEPGPVSLLATGILLATVRRLRRSTER